MMNKILISKTKMSKLKIYHNKQSLIRELLFLNLRSSLIKFQDQTLIIKLPCLHQFHHQEVKIKKLTQIYLFTNCQRYHMMNCQIVYLTYQSMKMTITIITYKMISRTRIITKTLVLYNNKGEIQIKTQILPHRVYRLQDQIVFQHLFKPSYSMKKVIWLTVASNKEDLT